MAGRSLALLGLLVLPTAAAAAAGGGSDADRFGHFVQRARASGTIELVLRFEGVKQAGCEAAGTCGVTGTVTTKLKLDPSRRVAAPAGGLVVLPAKGTVTANIRNPKCRDKIRLASAGVAYAADPSGLLLRPGAVAAGAAAQDPFATRCAGPSLLDLGNEVALPAVRLKRVPRGVRDVRLAFHDRRQELTAAGYAGSVVVRGNVRLRAR